jgi:hypothetical protein
VNPNPVGEDGGPATVTATVDPPAPADFTVEVASDADATVAALSATTTLSFDEGETESTGEVTISPKDNADHDGDVEVTISGTIEGATDVMAPDNVILTITDDELVPSAPRNLEVVAGDGEATLSWTAPGQLGSASGGLTGYVWKATVAGETEAAQEGTAGSTATEAIVSGLSNGVTYTFTVRAETSLGEGDPASAVGKPVPTISLTVIPGTITEDGETTAEVTATLSSSSMEAITVTVEVDDAALATVADATIEFAAEATTSTDVATVTAVDNPLDEDNTVEVTATSVNATAPATATTVTITDDDEAPSAPTSLSATGEAGAVLLSWQFDAANDWGTATTGRGFEYRVRVTSGDDFEDEDADWQDAGNDLTRALRVTALGDGTTLAAGTGYTFEVRAVSEAGSSTADDASGTPSS